MNPRRAVPSDVAALRELIALSARGLSAGYYTAEQIEAAVTHVFGVDTQLIADGTYRALLAKWKLTDYGIEKATINAGQ